MSARARQRMLGRVRAALDGRETVDHPGAFGGWRPEASELDPVERFRLMFEVAGGGFVRVAELSEAARWLGTLASDFRTSCAGASVPTELVAPLPRAEPSEADLGVSMARAAVAETGSLVLDARDGRRVQLLPPVHVVFVSGPRVVPTLSDALLRLRGDLPSALGLHSGPSKSADIGQTLVKGVHGPGRVVAVVIG